MSPTPEQVHMSQIFSLSYKIATLLLQYEIKSCGVLWNIAYVNVVNYVKFIVKFNARVEYNVCFIVVPLKL
jgi:hypothetical protein